VYKSIQSIVEKGVRVGTRGIFNVLMSVVPESTASDRIHNQQMFKQNLRSRYNCIHHSNPDLTKCMVLGVYLSTDCMAAVHLVPLQDRRLIPLLGGVFEYLGWKK
jgi:hypothetical protein